MARFELLVGSQVFWRRARADLAAARSRVLVQAMTFEGDRAGLAIAEAIARSPATDRRVLIDDFSRHKISDHMIHLPQNLLDSDLRDERRATMEMFARLQASGARLRITNPIGLKPWRFPVRNHKKLLVIDSVAYVGGLNFSDHNFAWDDLMVRIEGAGLAGFVAADFERTWASEPAFAHAAFDGAEVFALDGRTNTERFGVLLSRLDRAGERIVVISPYLTSPFTDALADASARGVGVTVFSPWDNNKRIVRDALAAAARRTTIDLRLTSGMSHMKALLIDDRELIVGSSNFDFVSYRCQEEIVLAVTDPDLVETFRDTVLTPLETAVLGGDAHDISLLARHGGTAALKIADRFCQALSDEPRFCIVLDGRERLEPDRSMRDRKNR